MDNYLLLLDHTHSYPSSSGLRSAPMDFSLDQFSTGNLLSVVCSPEVMLSGGGVAGQMGGREGEVLGVEEFALQPKPTHCRRQNRIDRGNN